jgi:hypothetical protein
MSLRGLVKNGVVVFQNAAAPPDGTIVEVTPVEKGARASAERPAGPAPYPVSEEQRKALLELIGMWKIENPPGDEEVERIIDEFRHGSIMGNKQAFVSLHSLHTPPFPETYSLTSL